MGSAGDGTEDLILDAMFGDDRAPNMPDTIYFALYTTTPADTGGGTEVSTSGTDYTRVGYDNDNTTWDPASGSQKTNAVDIQFPEAAAVWGAITHWAIHTVGTAGLGEPMVWGALASPVSVTTGVTPRFVAGAFVVYAD